MKILAFNCRYLDIHTSDFKSVNIKFATLSIMHDCCQYYITSNRVNDMNEQAYLPVSDNSASKTYKYIYDKAISCENNLPESECY